MSNEPSPPEPVNSKQGPEFRPARGISRLLGFIRPRARKTLVGLGIFSTFVIAASIGYFKVGSELTSPPPEQTIDVRFDEQLRRIEASPEPIARLDALVINDGLLQKLTLLEKLTTIQVETDSLTLDTVMRLAAMPHLEQLHLRGAEIDDVMLKELAKSKTIWLLNFPKTTVTPAAIEGLKEMPELRQLRLGIDKGDNRHARAVATLPRLRAVHLIGVAVTDEGLRPLAKMPQLESLYLDDAAVTDSGWTWLFQENTQLHVHINQLHHDRDPQKHKH